jgi:uncharacterized protein
LKIPCIEAKAPLVSAAEKQEKTMSAHAQGTIRIGQSHKEEVLFLKLANRHGLITGATGTGKTVTLQTLAEGFSAAGVPVFAADIKGDLSGICAPGQSLPHFVKRASEMGLTYQPDAFPSIFWDVFGEQGHPIRATISEMGPLLLARLLELNDVQEGVLNIAFRIADEEGLLLLDLKDLRAILAYVSENASELTTTYGNVSPQTVGTIQRQLLVLENQGADQFFGEPALDLNDLMRLSSDGRGIVNILAADKLMQAPRVYSTFLLWLLSELFEQLPEVGDLEKPKLVFFFDEAHLLFNDAPKALVEKIEQVVRLIRSKGVGVYFVTQNPLDVPETILAQLGNRIQHALRAFTPRDQKAVQTAAETFRPNPKLDTARVIMELGVGEALVSVLEGKGIPTVVERTFIKPPFAQVGPLNAEQRAWVLGASPVKGKYDAMIDRESAFELLANRREAPVQDQTSEQSEQPQEEGGSGGGILGTMAGLFGGAAATVAAQTARKAAGGGIAGTIAGSVARTAVRKATGANASTGARGSNRMGMGEALVRSAGRAVVSSVGRQIGSAIVRGVLGSILK